MSRADVRRATSRWNSARYRPEAHRDNIVLTPPWLVARIRNDVLGGTIDLDPATTLENPTGATRFVHLPEDGIMADWSGNVFVNPPWGRTLPLWIERAILAGGSARVVMLVPARTDVRWFQRALRACDNALLFGRRLDYVFNGQAKRVRGATGALFASALFGFGVSLEPLSDLGTVVKPSEKTA